jgi:hypothetical protein
MKNSMRYLAVATSLSLVMATTVAGAALAKSSWKIKAIPVMVDPDGTQQVTAKWLSRAGLPDTPSSSKAKKPKKFKPGHALYLSKGDATATNASARVSILGVEGITLNEIGWDVRTDGSCSVSSPRFEVVTQDDVLHTIGCDSPTLSVTEAYTGWERRRYDLAAATPPLVATATEPTDPTTPDPATQVIPASYVVKSITIVLDQGPVTDTTTGATVDPGFVYLDNIDINGLWIQKPGVAQAK